MEGQQLVAAYQRIRETATRLAGAPGDIPQRAAVHHAIWLDSGQNHAFPQVALHGALWAERFFETTGPIARAVTYRYFYSSFEREMRTAMLSGFSEGFKEANRSVFIDTYTNYVFTKRHGREAGAGDVIHPELLERLNDLHDASRTGLTLSRPDRRTLFVTALEYEQEVTVSPKVTEEVAKFDCPILRTLVLKPFVRFAYFPRWRYLHFQDFADKAERIDKAIACYELAEDRGWDVTSAAMRAYKSMPAEFFAEPRDYGRRLGAALDA